MQESQTDKEEMRQQQRMKVMTDMTKENQVEGKDGREQQLVGHRANVEKKKWLQPGLEDTLL